MHIFQLFTYAAVVDTLKQGYAVPAFYLSDNEWNHMATYLPLQSENMMVYAAVLSAPGELCEPDALERTSQEADWQFEDTQHARFNDGTLQL